MNRSYENRGFDYFYIIDPLCEVVVDYEIGIIESNIFKHIIAPQIKRINNTFLLEYRVNGWVSFKSYIHKEKLQKSDIVFIFSEMIKSINEVDECLLDIEKVSFCVDDIFVDVINNTLRMCYVCGRKIGIRESFMNLFENIIENIDAKDKYVMDLVYGIYGDIQDGQVDLSVVIKKIEGAFKDEPNEKNNRENEDKYMEIQVEDSEDNKKDNSPKINYQTDSNENKTDKLVRMVSIAAIVVDLFALVYIGYKVIISCASKTDYKMAVVLVIALGVIIYLYDNGKHKGTKSEEDDVDKAMREYKESQQTIDSNNKYDCNDIYVEETVLDMENVATEEGTTVLNASNNDYYVLVPENKELGNIIIDSESIIIGCNKNKCDAIIDAKGISRLHANIFIREGEMYITDLGSTNGTFVNGELIESGGTINVKDRDILAFGRERYTLRIN